MENKKDIVKENYYEKDLNENEGWFPLVLLKEIEF